MWQWLLAAAWVGRASPASWSVAPAFAHPMSENRRILTQKAMREARSQVDFCYLCGELLPPKGTPGRPAKITGEHVVPRGLLGAAPNDDAWVVELDVHRQCEATKKQRDDSMLTLLQRIHVDPVKGWPRGGHLRALNLQPGLIFPGGGVAPIPAFQGLECILPGAWTWVRGMHAALYARFLPDDVHHAAMPPVPACDSERDPSMEIAEKGSWLFRTFVQVSVDRAKWDGVSAWGNRLLYRCAWYHCPGTPAHPPWVCFWTLVFPGVLQWSRGVLGDADKRPWHGFYTLNARPANASVLDSTDLSGD